MSPRVRRARTIAMGAMAAGMVAVTPQLGLVMVPMFVTATLALATLDVRIRRASRPESVIANTIVLMMLLTGLSTVLTGGPESAVMPLVVIPVAVAAARFRAQVVYAAGALAAIVATATALSSGPGELVDHPLLLVGTLVLLVAITAVTTALMEAEVQFRSQSVLDPLTGLLNRGGLEARFVEVAEQARLLDQPVCMVLCDLDHFKAVNDTWGHDRGDAVLRDVSYEMRKSLRSFELFYRIGGEEFLVLLPGIDLPGGVHLAQALRAAIEDSRPGELAITGSFGVSAATGDDIEFLSLFRAADESLYASKSAGRNRVTAAGTTLEPARPSASPA